MQMTAPQPISLTERRGGTTRVRVYASLRDAIVRADLAPGRQLSENELAASLGVSRTPVREALQRLRDDRLVEIVPQLGTFVSPISTRAVADAQFIREALECAAVRAAAGRVTDEDLEGLEQNLVAQERARETADFDAFYVLDDQFHQSLCDLSGRAVWAITQRAKGHLNRIRRLSLPMPSYLAEMIAEHREIVVLLGEHDPDGAEAALRHHLQMVLRELPRIREQHPDFFEED
jgi:GntR family transcriptional regulator, rspAB operon transcriptional repressor